MKASHARMMIRLMFIPLFYDGPGTITQVTGRRTRLKLDGAAGRGRRWHFDTSKINFNRGEGSMLR